MKKHNSLSLPWPVDWAGFFGRSAPLIVEIGFGNGSYLMHLADQNPDANIVGLEISNQSMEKAEKRIVREARTNVRVINTPAETALYHLFEPQTVQAFHVNYPDPWFKTRHSGRRLIKRETVDSIVSRLVVGGMFYLATDIVAYAEMAHQILIETPGLDNTLDQPWVHDLPGRFRTKYEQKGLRENRPGNYFVYRRNDTPAPAIPVYKEHFMPHIILESPMQPSEILAQFEGRLYHHKDDTHVTIINAYVNHDDTVLLFETNINEPTIDQHPALMLFKRQSGDYILRMGSTGNPRPTDGVHQAVGFLADWVADLHPDGKIINRRIKQGF